MLFQIKKYSGKLLTPIGKRISRIPANYLTLSSLISCIATFFCYFYHKIGIAIIFLFLVEFFDQLDGIVARIQGPTQFGAFLDSTLDRYGDVFLYAGLYMGKYGNKVLILVALIGALLTSYTRARIESLGVDTLGGVGLLERTDRIPLLLIGTIMQIWIGSAIQWTIIFLIIGSHLTAFQRIWYARNHLLKKKKN